MSWARSHAAWVAAVFAVSVCPDLMDPAEALRETGRAVAEISQNAWHLLKHGAVLYRNSRYEEARETLEQSSALSIYDDPSTMFHLSMAESRLGNAARAGAAYDRGVARVAKTYPDHPEWERYRSEAEALLDSDS